MDKWLFFDVGSTLVDETNCEKQRILDTISSSNIGYDRFYQVMKYYASQNMNSYKCAIERFEVQKAFWRSELEVLYPQTENVLINLSMKYNLGVIANQNLCLSERLKQFGILKYFKLVISSADVGFSKPDEKIFTLALNQSDCSAQNAYMIGDRLDNDIIPAQTVGMKTVWIRQGFGKFGNPSKLLISPDYIVENLSELLSLNF